ncbi:MAG: helix-turn-helix transcriptional regulator [Kiritimatiellae bacterium]|nr:helix-turn-helix transcriptional regulator [Kiritimatiellia bacterium]
MNNEYILVTPEEVAIKLAEKTVQLRLARNWKQSTLAERAGVSLPSVRRFENTGLISLKHLLRLVFVLGHLSDFELVLNLPVANSINELESLSTQPKVKRGTE